MRIRKAFHQPAQTSSGQKKPSLEAFSAVKYSNPGIAVRAAYLSEGQEHNARNVHASRYLGGSLKATSLAMGKRNTMRAAFLHCTCVFALGYLSIATAYADVITFEDLPDAYFFSGGDQNIGTYYPGITFGPDVTGLSVSRFGGYDSSGFPPHSGDVAIWDATDSTITISFASPISSFGIWYTTYDPLTLEAFDASNDLLGTVIGSPNTDGTTGVPSLLTFSSPGIESVNLTSTAGLFVLDDLTYTSGAGTVPEPTSFLYLAAGALLFGAKTHGRRT